MRTVSIPREQIFQGPLVLVNRAHPLHEKERSALTSVDRSEEHTSELQSH